jgi:hypothetical protein
MRGFNLDHATDLRTTIDGMLVNQRSHSHGQGWTDVHFLIPELAALLDYRKGLFYAADGDFSSAGSLRVNYANKLEKGIFSLGLGQKTKPTAARPAVSGCPATGAKAAARHSRGSMLMWFATNSTCF